MGVKIPKALSVGEETMAQHLSIKGIPYHREYKFHPTRKWAFDFAIYQSIAVEIEGGTKTGGRHTRHEGFEADCEKYNEAALLGWKVLRFTTGMVKSGKAIQTIMRALKK